MTINSTLGRSGYLVKLADKLDAIGAYAMADILDESAIMLKRAQQVQQMQQAQLADRLVNIHAEMLNALRMFSSSAQMPTAMKRLLDQVREFGLAAHDMKQSISTPVTASQTIQELVVLADQLDSVGKHVLAEMVDRAAEIVNNFDENLPMKPGHKSSLSTRYCPDHVGVQAVRVSECVYQCPVDGRTYDYEGGYTNYRGQRVPGGSIAAQTPMTTPYALPQRLFDSRQSVLNTIN